MPTPRKLAVAALVAAPILPVTMTGRAEAAPAALIASPAKPAASTVAHRKHLAHVIADANRKAREARKHAIAKANREARRAAGGTRARLMRVAASYRGVPYVYGGASRHGVDCSGYVDRVYLEALRKRLPRTVSGLRRVARITRSPRPGDIVFYAGGGHVALVAAVRGGKVTNTWVARHTGTRVQQQVPYTAFVVGVVI